MHITYNQWCRRRRITSGQWKTVWQEKMGHSRSKDKNTSLCQTIICAKEKKKRKTTWWVTSIYIHTSVQGSLYNLTALPAAANPSLHAPAFNTVDFAKVTLSSFMFTATVSLDSVCSSSCVYYGVGLVLLAESLAAQIWGFPQRGEPFLCKHLQW